MSHLWQENISHKNSKQHIEDSDLSEKKNANLTTLIYDLRFTISRRSQTENNFSLNNLSA